MNRTTARLTAIALGACIAGSAWAQPVGLAAPNSLDFLALVPSPAAGVEPAFPGASQAFDVVYYADAIVPMTVTMPAVVRITTLVDLSATGNRSGNAAMYSMLRAALREGGERPGQVSSRNDPHGQGDDRDHGHRHGRIHLDDGIEVGEHGGVTPVPLPPALPLLGAALAALMLAGTLARRS